MIFSVVLYEVESYTVFKYTTNYKVHIQACVLSILETSGFNDDYHYYDVIIISLYYYISSSYHYIIIVIKSSLLYIQACALSLLETCVFHVDVAEAVADAGPDLVDYCVR